MQKITSFTIDHLRLQTGLYVSRVDTAGQQAITTFDIRMTRPNTEPVMDTAAVHALEHLGATWLRNNPDWQEKILYFGPMGCRTGFYLLLAGAYTSRDALDLIDGMFRFVAAYEGEIPGAAAKDCGNYLDLNLDMAKYYARKYIREVLDHPTEDRLNYPE